MPHEVRSFAIQQTAAVVAALYFLVLLLFVPFAILTAVLGGEAGAGTILLILIAPVIYGVVAYVATAVGAWIYNRVARRMGGIEVELVELP